eukprot:Lankesteria_metandrocarpae@DN5478_c0_g1_i2.p1
MWLVTEHLSTSSCILCFGILCCVVDFVLYTINWKWVIDQLSIIILAIRLRLRWVGLLVILVSLTVKLSFANYEQSILNLNLVYPFMGKFNHDDTFDFIIAMLVLGISCVSIIVFLIGFLFYRGGTSEAFELAAVLQRCESLEKSLQNLLSNQVFRATDEHYVYPAGTEENEGQSKKRVYIERSGLSDEDVGRNNGDVVPSFGKEDMESNRRCRRCGNSKHVGSQCPFLRLRCFRCQLIGHSQYCCPNFVVSDSTGRVRTRVEPRPSGTTIVHKQDRTQKDKMITAEELIKQVRNLVAQRADRAKLRKRTKARVEDNEIKSFAVGGENRQEDRQETMVDVHMVLDALEQLCSDDLESSSTGSDVEVL